jgi:hypothetical protein
MYNLQKAKEEIDAVAKHATDLTEYVIALSERHNTVSQGVDARLETIKTELLAAIDAKLAEVRHALFGGEEKPLDSSAIADLGAKVSQLTQREGSSFAHDPSAAYQPGQPHHEDHHSHDGDHHN